MHGFGFWLTIIGSIGYFNDMTVGFILNGWVDHVAAMDVRHAWVGGYRHLHGCSLLWFLPPLHGCGVLSPESWMLQLMGIHSQCYRYLSNLLLSKASPSNISLLAWLLCRTLLSPDVFTFHLHSHPGQNFASYILHGISTGFHIGYQLPISRDQISQQQPYSSLANPAVIDARIAAELVAGCVIGPLLQGTIQQILVTPIGLFPNGHAFSKWWTIVDLSSLIAFHVNNAI